MVNFLRPAGSRWSRAVACALVGVVALAGTACGKKGPPLAPLVRLPAAPDALAARRFGSTVYLRFTVPSRNQDNSTPADIGRVEVYGYTGAPETDEDMVKYGTLVATVRVRRPPPPEEEDRARRKEQPAKAGKPRAARKPKKAAEPEPGVDQGAAVTVTETLNQALTLPVSVVGRRSKTAAPAPAPPALLPVASLADVPSRVYVAVAVSRGGHRGAFSRHSAVPLIDAPAPPTDLQLTQSETALTLRWNPPPEAPGSPAEPQEPDVALLPVKRLPLFAGATWSYEVFEVPAEKPVVAGATPTPAGRPPVPPVDLPAALNQQPVTAPTYTDQRMAFGTTRCYVVRAVRSFGPLQEDSDASNEACITPRDIYPPAAPKGLTAVVNAGGVSLIWEPNAEPDLDGYFVLRAEAPDGTLQRLTRDPVHETTFNDTTVKPGTRYVYVVIAVDKTGNASAESNRVEETAR